MKKLFVFGDVHSFYDELMEALDKAGFDKDDPDHLIMSLGDLCDRGPKSKEVLSFINSLPEERKFCVIGNHEIMMELMIKRGYPEQRDIINGVVDTARKISEEDGDFAELKKNTYWNEYKKHWHWYYEIGDYIFVHGWIPCVYDPDDLTAESYEYKPDWRNSSIEELYDSTYFNGMVLWSKGIREEGKTIFCGHWNSSWGNCHLHHDGAEFADEEHPYANHGSFIDEGIIALDACTVRSHKVNVHVLELVEDAF